MPIREDRKGQGKGHIVDTGLGVTQFSKWFPSPVSTPSVLWAMLSCLCLNFHWTRPGVTFATSNKSTFLTQDKAHAQVYRTLWLRLSVLLPAPPSHHTTWYIRELRTLPSGPGLSLQTTISFSDTPQEKWLYLPTYDAGKTFPLSGSQFVLSY